MMYVLRFRLCHGGKVYDEAAHTSETPFGALSVGDEVTWHKGDDDHVNLPITKVTHLVGTASVPGDTQKIHAIQVDLDGSTIV